MSQSAIDFIKTRIVSTQATSTGDILTESIITFDNGSAVKGASVRALASFDKTEAENAAVENAISGLVAGVDFILNK